MHSKFFNVLSVIIFRLTYCELYCRNDSGLTPVHLAAIAGHDTVLTFLLEHSPSHTIEILDNDNVSMNIRSPRIFVLYRLPYTYIFLVHSALCGM